MMAVNPGGPMAEVSVRDVEGGVEVVVDKEVVHTARTAEAAEQLAQWVTFQLGSGANKQDLLRMLRGEAPKKTDGYSGGADPQAGESSPRRQEKKRARAEKKEKKVDLSILDGRLTQVKRAVHAGECDDYLEELLKAEEEGKARKTVFKAIQDRMDALE